MHPACRTPVQRDGDQHLVSTTCAVAVVGAERHMVDSVVSTIRSLCSQQCLFSVNHAVRFWTQRFILPDAGDGKILSEKEEIRRREELKQEEPFIQLYLRYTDLIQYGYELVESSAPDMTTFMCPGIM